MDAEQVAVPVTASAWSRVASFYFRHLAIFEGRVRDWSGMDPVRYVPVEAVHVAVARTEAYAIDSTGRLVRWVGDELPAVVLDGVVHVSAGESAVLAVRDDGSLVESRTGLPPWRTVAAGMRQGCVGDSSDYCVGIDGTLHVRGLAHRGQYGDALCIAVEGWKAVATGVAAVCAHTGHAVLMKIDGTVQGTGGNRFGPLGHHGFGDKADCWGTIFESATTVATGARHTVAIRSDGTLWHWGEHVGLTPSALLSGIAAVACGDNETVALDRGGRLWCWRTGETPRQTG